MEIAGERVNKPRASTAAEIFFNMDLFRPPLDGTAHNGTILFLFGLLHARRLGVAGLLADDLGGQNELIAWPELYNTLAGPAIAFICG